MTKDHPIHMSQQIDHPSIKEELFLKLQQDHSIFDPSSANTDKIRCCMCGRLLAKDQFSLEHIIPQQALKADLRAARTLVPTNTRAGLTLLCNTPLELKGRKYSEKGCNSWKGAKYDTNINKIINGGINKINHKNPIISLLSLCYLALFSKFGYRVAFTKAGIICRKQFFSPTKFQADLPDFSQLAFLGSSPLDITENNQAYWSSPFWFDEGQQQVGQYVE